MIDRFYEAAARPELWRETLHDLAVALGGEGIAIVTTAGAPEAVCSPGLDALVVDYIGEGWAMNNPRLSRGMPAALSGRMQLATNETLLAPEEIKRHPFNAVLLRRHGLGSYVGSLVGSIGNQHLAMSVERALDKEPFGGEELEIIEQLLPHFRRAGRLTLQTSLARAQGMLDGLDWIRCGAVLLGHDGTVIGFNDAAQRWIGDAVQITFGRIRASHHASDVALQALIAGVSTAGDAHRTRGPAAVKLQRRAGAPVFVSAAPIVRTAKEIFRAASAVLLITAPDEAGPAAAASVLAALYGLTPAEARLAVALSDGASLPQAAERLKIAHETARDRLKAVFTKTDTRRQAELVRLLSHLMLHAREPG